MMPNENRTRLPETAGAERVITEERQYLGLADPKEGRLALCLSGGGIRSATFSLGVLQWLAHKRLLSRFHYLSTVSGGGYIGSWLSRWAREAGITAVESALGDLDADRSRDCARTATT